MPQRDSKRSQTAPSRPPRPPPPPSLAAFLTSGVCVYICPRAPLFFVGTLLVAAVCPLPPIPNTPYNTLHTTQYWNTQRYEYLFYGGHLCAYALWYTVVDVVINLYNYSSMRTLHVEPLQYSYTIYVILWADYMHLSQSIPFELRDAALLQLDLLTHHAARGGAPPPGRCRTQDSARRR